MPAIPTRKRGKMEYEIIWNAVDNLAKSLGLSPSGLAKKAGLDATTFNKSKRIRPDGKHRWPSLDSLNKVFEFCNIDFDEFYKFGQNKLKNDSGSAIPFIRVSNFNKKKYFIGNDLDTRGWEMFSFPDGTKNLYALEVDSDESAPLYRFGTTIVLAKRSDIRRGDRVAIYLNNNKIIFAEFVHRKAKTLELCDLNDNELKISIDIADTRLVSRIVWASQ